MRLPSAWRRSPRLQALRAYRCRSHCQPQRPPLPAASAAPAAERRPAGHSPQAASRSAHTVGASLLCCFWLGLCASLQLPGDRRTVQIGQDGAALAMALGRRPSRSRAAPRCRRPATPSPVCCRLSSLTGGAECDAQEGMKGEEKHSPVFQGHRQQERMNYVYERGRLDWQDEPRQAGAFAPPAAGRASSFD